MIKKSEQSGITKKLRRTKLIQSFNNIVKQQEILTPPEQKTSNPIMLTDLCSEEKAKIVDLIKMLENKNIQNKELEQKILQKLNNQSVYLEQIEDLKIIISQAKQHQKLLKQQNNLLKVKECERERYIFHLNSEMVEYKSKEKFDERSKVDQFSMSDPIFTNNQGCQIAPKRIKKKQQQSQTQTMNPSEFHKNANKTYSAQSQQFERLMKNQQVSSKLSIHTTSLNQNINKNQKKTKSKILDEQYRNLEENDNYEESYYQQQNYIKGQFKELAEEWFELKQRKRSKLRQSNTNKRKYTQLKFKHSIQDQKLKLPNFVLKDKQQRYEEQLDEIELNKILKSKNFSASQLLNSGKKIHLSSN